MKVRKTSLLLFLLLTGQGTLFASGAKENGLPLPLSQQADKISITGSVVDSKGEPLIGVSILEEGTPTVPLLTSTVISACQSVQEP